MFVCVTKSIHCNTVILKHCLVGHLVVTVQMVSCFYFFLLFFLLNPYIFVSTHLHLSIIIKYWYVGKNVAAGSSSPGTVFIWKTVDGKLEKKIENVHSAGVVGIAWGRGGSNGQQVATVDKKGSMVLWA